MCLMCLEVNKLEWRQEQVIENQKESDDEFDSKYEIKLEKVEDFIEILFELCKRLEEFNIVRLSS